MSEERKREHRSIKDGRRPVSGSRKVRTVQRSQEEGTEERVQKAQRPRGSEQPRRSESMLDPRDPRDRKALQNRKIKQSHKGKKKASLISNIVLVIALVVFCVSGFQLFKIAKGYLDGRSEYEKVRDLAIEDSGKAEDGEGESEFKVNFDKLLEMNPDTIGWIRFSPEPEIINYPIVQGEDNDVYLHKTFSDSENTLGAIFLNVHNKSDFNDYHSIIYGHRMKDGSMFRHLQDYDDKSFWEENPYFYIYTPDGRKITYHIYSAEQILDTSETYNTEFADDEEFQQFLSDTAESSIYKTEVDMKDVKSAVTLSTCTSASDENRFVVRGVKIKEEQM